MCMICYARIKKTVLFLKFGLKFLCARLIFFVRFRLSLYIWTYCYNIYAYVAGLSSHSVSQLTGPLIKWPPPSHAHMHIANMCVVFIHAFSYLCFSLYFMLFRLICKTINTLYLHDNGLSFMGSVHSGAVHSGANLKWFNPARFNPAQI